MVDPDQVISNDQEIKDLLSDLCSRIDEILYVKLYRPGSGCGCKFGLTCHKHALISQDLMLGKRMITFALEEAMK